MKPVTRRWILAGGATAVVAIVVAAVIGLRGGSAGTEPAAATPSAAADEPSSVAARYLDAFAAGNATAAGNLTDDPAAASALLAAVRTGLPAAQAQVLLRQVTPAGDGKASGAFHVTWTLGAGRTWAYDNSLQLIRTGDHWSVHWTPALVHPKLEANQRLALRTRAGTPAVVDRDGKPLMLWQESGIQPAEGNPAPLLRSSMTKLTQEQGAGGWSVTRTDAAGADVETLGGTGTAQAKPLTITLGAGAQGAAQAAVDGARFPAALLALQPSSGEILAVAQNAAAGLDPKAFSGLYAPGSTFKIATAAAVLQHGGQDANTVLDCPASVQLGQRTIPNDNNFALPPQPLHSAFAHSCNTTFAQLASGLPADALARAASQFGLNADFEIPGISSEAGKVEPAANQAEQVENAIGQGKVQASPFGIALMAATVAAGRAVTPKLWRGLDTRVNTGYQPPPGGVIGALRQMMREVVTGGTASELRGSGQVFGKTGTAQFGDGTQSDGWFAGYRGDVAFAVLLKGAGSSKPAVAAAATFLSGL
ncbi:penicillin-binding transpeptidase domain-containing protein [Amycolatopsis anabasis]|uniref:penicillin-binding transpeptidase domain-containing protein n=1 Tax=Amycolatopsis anabasis TaxID=1840409 RepID=UPI001FED175E|nr:penicillin-binding transpeptidase domain-containing protein [Amycolatopsis anabasis]